MQDKTINLIILDSSFDTEEKVVSTLRSHGFAARSNRVEDDEDLIDAIKERTPDIVLYTNSMELISLAQTRKVLDQQTNNAPVPLIAVDHEEGSSVAVDVMRNGAADLSSYSNIDHLNMVIKREFAAFQNWKNNSRLLSAFEESEKRCESLLDSSRDAIAYVHEGMHVYSNDSYLELFGLKASEDLEGMPILDMVAKHHRETFKANLRNFMQGVNNEGHDSLRMIKSDGTEFDGKIEFSPASIDGEPCVQIVLRQQAADSEELERQLKLMSQKDQLTGLFNRQYSLEKLEEMITYCSKNETHAALLTLQIDNFENVKSSLGVFGADKFLTLAAKTLDKATGKDDLLARYLYSSFTIIVKDKDEQQVIEYAKQLQKTISELEAEIENNAINTTCSIGITLIDKDSPDCNEILARAEKATGEASEQGTNQLKLYVPEAGELTRDEVDTKFRAQLTDALKNDNFLLHFQPIVSLHGDIDERYEVFIRMVDPDTNELIMPHDFLPAAERIGMAIAIDRWVLYKTITVLTQRRKAGYRTRLFLKLSAASLTDETLIDWLNFQIKEKKLPDNSLVFEVKENIAVTNLKHTKELSEKLHKIKCGFVLDDFGTGTNPFQLLDHIHVDYVRMERSFMENLAENPQHQEIIQNIAERAAELGKFSIAQFVPDAGSLSILWGMGVNFIQGHFLQEPSAELNYDFTEMTG